MTSRSQLHDVSILLWKWIMLLWSWIMLLWMWITLLCWYGECIQQIFSQIVVKHRCLEDVLVMNRHASQMAYYKQHQIHLNCYYKRIWPCRSDRKGLVSLRNAHKIFNVSKYQRRTLVLCCIMKQEQSTWNKANGLLISIVWPNLIMFPNASENGKQLTEDDCTWALYADTPWQSSFHHF